MDARQHEFADGKVESRRLSRLNATWKRQEKNYNVAIG